LGSPLFFCQESNLAHLPGVPVLVETRNWKVRPPDYLEALNIQVTLHDSNVTLVSDDTVKQAHKLDQCNIFRIG
jgi:hypothetical protein